MPAKPIVYRPRSVVLGWLMLVTFFAAPVTVLVFARAPVVALILALVLCPFGLAVWLLMFGSVMRVTGSGIYLRTHDETVTLAWEDIRRFDCLNHVVIYTRSGRVHPVAFLETAPAQRMLGTLGYGDYVAQDLNIMLMERTGRADPQRDTNEIRPQLTAESPAGRARMAKVAYAGFASSALGIVAVNRIWWGLPLALAVIGLFWLSVRRLKRR